MSKDEKDEESEVSKNENSISEQKDEEPQISKKRDKKFQIHGPSLGIGAAIAAVSIIAAFFAVNIADDAPQVELEPVTVPEPEQAPQKLSLSTFTANGSPVLGDENAPITLVEFGDYQCHFCNKFFHDTEHDIIENYVNTGKVKLIFKDYVIIGPDSFTAALATHCAGDQGKFWEFHDALYNYYDGENSGFANMANQLKYAKELELNMNEFTQCLEDKIHEEKVVASVNDARVLGLTGTPAFFVLGEDSQIQKIGGAQPFHVFEQVFEEMLKK